MSLSVKQQKVSVADEVDDQSSQPVVIPGDWDAWAYTDLPVKKRPGVKVKIPDDLCRQSDAISDGSDPGRLQIDLNSQDSNDSTFSHKQIAHSRREIPDTLNTWGHGKNPVTTQLWEASSRRTVNCGGNEASQSLGLSLSSSLTKTGSHSNEPTSLIKNGNNSHKAASTQKQSCPSKAPFHNADNEPTNIMTTKYYNGNPIPSSIDQGKTSHIQTQEGMSCTNCGTLVRIMWRRSISRERVCNACYAYFKSNGVNPHSFKLEIIGTPNQDLRGDKPRSKATENSSEQDEMDAKDHSDLHGGAPHSPLSGWKDCHYHVFKALNLNTKKIDFIGRPIEKLEKGPADSSSRNIVNYFMKPGDSAEYWYDFGDRWEHKVVLQKILPFDEDKCYPACIGGKRACPPEDSGGTDGYNQLLEIIKNKKHPEYASRWKWLKETHNCTDFDPEKFQPIDVDFSPSELRKSNYYNNAAEARFYDCIQM